VQKKTEGRIALVTGGSRGIGRAICLKLASMGTAVGIHYNRRKDAALEVSKLIREKGGQSVLIQTDLSKAGSGTELIGSVKDLFGGVDILVNNAGIMTDSPVNAMTDEMWEESLAINLSSAFRCVRAAIPHMKEKGWGRIINLTSQAAYTGSANHAHYAAAKAGLLGFTYSLAKELGSYGITVNAVSPGRISTDMLLERSQGREQEWLAQTPLGRFGNPEEVASAVGFLASDQSGYITGAVLNVNGGLVMG
jgi:NAD(P)-dependent dehydrogenase (short-subunit alcohol dehydrogenase family)